MTKPTLTKEEIATLKAAKKILKRISKKHKKLVDDAWKRKGEYDSPSIENFEDSLYKLAKIDFYHDDDAVIRIN